MSRGEHILAALRSYGIPTAYRGRAEAELAELLQELERMKGARDPLDHVSIGPSPRECADAKAWNEGYDAGFAQAAKLFTRDGK